MRAALSPKIQGEWGEGVRGGGLTHTHPCVIMGSRIAMGLDDVECRKRAREDKITKRCLEKWARFDRI